MPSFRKSILHWKPIPDVDAQESFLLLQNRNRRGNKFIQWISLKPGSKRQIFGDANVYFKGLSVSLPPSSKIGTKYCFERNSGEKEDDGGGSSSSSFSEIRIRNESFWIIFADIDTSCGGGNKNTNMRIKGHVFSGLKGIALQFLLYTWDVFINCYAPKICFWRQNDTNSRWMWPQMQSWW